MHRLHPKGKSISFLVKGINHGNKKTFERRHFSGESNTR